MTRPLPLYLCWILLASLANHSLPGETIEQSATRDLLPHTADSSNPSGKWGFNVSWTSPDEVRVPMKLREGIPSIPSLVNGKKVWMLLDTASQECVMEARTATSCGLGGSGAAMREVTLRGAGGSEKADLAILSNLAIGAFRLQQVPCIVRKEGSRPFLPWPLSSRRLEINVLGIKILHGACSYITLDYKNRVAIFGFSKAFQPGDATCGQAVTYEQSLPCLKISNGAREWKALLDTGSASEMEMNRAVADELGFTRYSEPAGLQQFGIGQSENGKQSAIRQVFLPTVFISGRTLRNINLLLVQSPSKIGSTLLSLFRTTLDFKRNMLWLE